MKVLFAVFALLCLTSAAAAEQAYECKLKAHSRYGWIPPVLLLSYDEKSQTAVVFDGIIKEVMGDPIAARFSRRDKNSIKLQWTVKGVPLSNQRGTLTAQYSAIFRTNTGKITVTVFLSGGTDMTPPRGSGKCKPVK